MISKAGVEGLSRQMHSAQGVRIACVGRPRKGQMGEPELSNPTQALNGRMVDDRQFLRIRLNRPMDRISNFLGWWARTSHACRLSQQESDAPA